MHSTLIVLNDLLLLACTSMYFGTGWSLPLFSFPIRPRLTVDNYYDQFVPPVERATKFFTWMTTLMMAAAVVLIVADWHSAYVIAPALLLAGVIGATALTIKFIFPYNHEMKQGITDPPRVQLILGKWMRLNVVRVSLWTIEWIVIAIYFGLKAA